MEVTHRPRRLLVTGGTGFIGSNFILRTLAARRHWHIANLDKLTYAADLTNLAGLAEDDRYQFVHGDICDSDLVKHLIADERIDTVVHFAAESHVDRSISDPTDFTRTNVLGTQTLLEACRAAWAKRPSGDSARFHHISTDEVFGSLSSTAEPFTERTAYAPNSPYSASKAASDHFVRAYIRTYGLPAVITNCSNNYGPRQHPEKFIPTVIRKAVAGEAIPVYGSGRNIRDWLFVDDHCEALLLVLEGGMTGGRYCIGGDCELSNIELAQRICGLLDELRPDQAPHERLIGFVTDRAGHDFRYAIDSSKMHDEFSWTPRIGLDNGLRRTVEWYLERLDAAKPTLPPASAWAPSTAAQQPVSA